MELARLIYESRYFIRVSILSCRLLHRESSRVLTTTTTMTLASRYRLCPLTCGLFALQDLWSASVNRTAKVGVDGNQIQPGQRNSWSNAARARLDRQRSIKRGLADKTRCILGKFSTRWTPRATSRLAYFCTVVYNPRLPVEAACQR